MRALRDPARWFAMATIAITTAASARETGSATPAPLVAATPKRTETTGSKSDLDIAIRRFTLDNGLRVVLNADPSSPNVAICVTYDVGARNERRGQAGFAHLFEHMMFQGSRNVPKGDHFRIVTARGGRMNGTTSSERTNYFETFPSSELALGLWLEADRMKTLAITQKKFENQRQVVQEEYRMRVTNRAYGLGRLRLYELAYQGYFPYEHTAIGDMDDLDAAKLEWVREFHDSYYAPNNAVLSISGDFDPQAALGLVQELFGDAKPQRNIPPVEAGDVPRQTSERLSVLEDTNAKTPGVYYGWVIPPGRTPEYYALEIAAQILAGGESSRLHQSLVRDKEMAQTVGAWTRTYRGPALFGMKMIITPRSSIDKAQKEVDRILRQLRAAGPTEAELEKAKSRIRSRFILGLQSNRRRAISLGWYETLWGDANLVNTEPGRYLAVSRQQVQEAVAKHLVDERRTIVEIFPPGWVKDEYPAILRRTHIVARGDTLIGIANKYGVRVADITKENNISRSRPIYPGQKIVVPKPTRTPKNTTTKSPKKATKKSTPTASSQRTKTTKEAMPTARTKRTVHVVKNGETLSGIAKRYGVTQQSIIQNNKVGPKKRIYIGQKLVIPPPKKR